MPRLVCLKGADEGKQFELGEAAVILAATPAARFACTTPKCRAATPSFASATACTRSSIVGSANGTFVNNQRIARRQAAGRRPHPCSAKPSSCSARAGRGRIEPASDLAEQISMITRADVELSSAIVKTIGEGEGSRILRSRTSNSAWLQVRAGQPGHHVRGQPGGQPHPRPRPTLDRILELDLPHRSRPTGAASCAQAPERDELRAQGRPLAQGEQPTGKDRHQPDHHGSRAARSGKACWSPMPPRTSASVRARASFASASAR